MSFSVSRTLRNPALSASLDTRRPSAPRAPVAAPRARGGSSFAPRPVSSAGGGAVGAVRPLSSAGAVRPGVGRGLAVRPRAEMSLTPFPRSSGLTFGAELRGVKVGTLTPSEFQAVERAVLEHQVLVIRDQGDLSPKDQLALTAKFDPQSTSYGHGNDAKKLAKSVLTRDLVAIPGVPQVKLLGHGLVRDHHGLDEVTLQHPSHRTFHHTPLTPEEEATGKVTRFYRWHIDAALYAHKVPRVTTLAAFVVPEARRQTVRYDDGSGHELEVPLGATAFVSGAAAYRALSPDLQALARRAQVRYAPHPYIWMKHARAEPTGLGLVSEGRELPRDQLPPIDPAHVMTLPMLWKNPLTQELALQVHAACVEDILIDGAPVGDLATTRALVQQLMRPGIDPERVYAHDWRPGDLVVFHNRGVWHSVTGSMSASDQRVFHQCNLAGSDDPQGPNATK